MRKTGKSRRPRSSRSLADARTGLFRATLLFGSAAIALSLIVVPEIDRRAKTFVSERGPDIDTTITTGSVAPAPGAIKRYTQRRSVLDGIEREPCLMFPDGTQKGSC